jgi:hypothetical protein
MNSEEFLKKMDKKCVRDAEGGEAGAKRSVARKRMRTPKQPDPSVSEGHAQIIMK